MFEIIHKYNGQWYFWDETWADRYGPFETYDECNIMFKHYCTVVLEGNPDLNDQAKCFSETHSVFESLIDYFFSGMKESKIK